MGVTRVISRWSFYRNDLEVCLGFLGLVLLVRACAAGSAVGPGN